MAPVIEPNLTANVQSGFSVSHETVELDIDLARRRLHGKAELTINPHSKDLKFVSLNARQCTINSISINSKPAPNFRYIDPYQKAYLPWRATVQQYHMLQERIEPFVKGNPESELVVMLPKSLRIEEMDPVSEEAQGLLLSKTHGSHKRGSDANAIDLAQSTAAGVEQTARFTPFTLSINYEIECLQDGMQFVGFDDGDLRYPHAYTTFAPSQSRASCLFPCVDISTSRCTWEISITTQKTVVDCYHISKQDGADGSWREGRSKSKASVTAQQQKMKLSDEDEFLEFTAVCAGEMIDEATHPQDSSKKTTSFISSKDLAPEHIGFAIGVFERVDLAEFRDSDENDLLGQSAIPLHAYCLPGRVEDTQNTCLPLAKAIDFITLTYGSFPFPNYGLCFVDDLSPDVVHVGSMSICASRLLFPENVLDPIDPVTRTLVYALASQWIGVDIVPRLPEDTWAVVGMAHFVTDTFMSKLCGKNEYRYRQKKACDRVVDIDVDRPSLLELGSLLHLDSSEQELLDLKAPLVLFILDQRLTKTSSSSGLARIISRIFLNAKVGDLANGILDSAYFIRQCEKLGHAKLDQFFTQWVESPGCPRFRVTQRFNKKKLVVEMSIQQVQTEHARERAKHQTVHKETFMRDFKEEQLEIYNTEILPCFTGPMTIRIHEADGTPYEHIVEIKETLQRFEIPYNTKYKRLKRGRRQKDRQVAGAPEYAGDGTDDVLLYSLGDVLQTEEDLASWRLAEWTAEDEERMSQESYEWVRMDADFEWICKLSLTMPGHMWVSQLQQDRDVVAQLESIEYLESQSGHPLISTFLIRTLMDQRYFYGIRTAAAKALAKSARDELNWIGLFHLETAFQKLFCYSDSSMVRPNDFSNRADYIIQCAIPKVIASIRDNSGRSTYRARKWLHDTLKYNDNSDNEYSDSFYVASLMESLASALVVKPRPVVNDMDEVEDPGDDDMRFFTSCVQELDRYRKIDEWIPSYHDIVSKAALDCICSLGKADVLKVHPNDILQYTADGNSDTVRICAFSNALELHLAKRNEVMDWFLTVLGTDSSTYVRDQLLQLLGRYLGAVAVGEALDLKKEAASQQALVVEEEASTEGRRAELERKQSIVGAATALREEIGSNRALQTGLWQAITSTATSLKQKSELLEICDILYTPLTAMVVALRLPRYWTCKRVGKGRVVFAQTDRVRTIPMPRKQIKLKFGSTSAAANTSSNNSDIPLAARYQSAGSPPQSSGALARPLLKPPKPLGAQMPQVVFTSGLMNKASSPSESGRAFSPPSVSESGKPKLKLKLKLSGNQ